MRVNLDNGNGALCDRCNAAMKPGVGNKIQVKKYIRSEQAYRNTRPQMDLCDSCLADVLKFVSIGK